jgi:hypothetical protein
MPLSRPTRRSARALPLGMISCFATFATFWHQSLDLVPPSRAPAKPGTASRLRGLRRALIDPAVARSGGRIVEITRGRILTEFPSDAVDIATRSGFTAVWLRPQPFVLCVGRAFVFHDRASCFA